MDKPVGLYKHTSYLCLGFTSLLHYYLGLYQGRRCGNHRLQACICDGAICYITVYNTSPFLASLNSCNTNLQNYQTHAGNIMQPPEVSLYVTLPQLDSFCIKFIQLYLLFIAPMSVYCDSCVCYSLQSMCSHNG